MNWNVNADDVLFSLSSYFGETSAREMFWKFTVEREMLLGGKEFYEVLTLELLF